MDDPPNFFVAGHKSLVAAGLGTGGARAWLIGDALVLIGEGQARRDLPVAAIDRIRVGAYDNKFAGKLYQMMLWSPDLPGPITLSSAKRDEAAFALIACALGTALAARQPPGRIEKGLAWLVALAFPLWMLGAGSVITLLQVLNAMQEQGESPLVTLGYAAAVFLPITAFVFWLFTWRYMPRNLAGAAEMERFLPGGEEGG